MKIKSGHRLSKHILEWWLRQFLPNIKIRSGYSTSKGVLEWSLRHTYLYINQRVNCNNTTQQDTDTLRVMDEAVWRVVYREDGTLGEMFNGFAWSRSTCGCMCGCWVKPCHVCLSFSIRCLAGMKGKCTEVKWLFNLWLGDKYDTWEGK